MVIDPTESLVQSIIISSYFCRNSSPNIIPKNSIVIVMIIFISITVPVIVVHQRLVVLVMVSAVSCFWGMHAPM